MVIRRLLTVIYILANSTIKEASNNTSSVWLDEKSTELREDEQMPPPFTSNSREQTIHRIGTILCPFADFCKKNKTKFLRPGSTSCCSACSCEEDCWETNTCCPDKDGFQYREPVMKCKLSIVKRVNNSLVYTGMNRGIWAYWVIDYCPSTELNATVIRKCALKDIYSIDDYRWVSSESTGRIYQNEFCAKCHGEKHLIKWELESRCEQILYSNFSQLLSLLLSKTCDLINSKPAVGPTPLSKRCAIPVYTSCNQTGEWTFYDKDIEWACTVFTALFFHYLEIKVLAYKNAFCYACNKPEIESATATCMKIVDNVTPRVFSALIDYRGSDVTTGIQTGAEMCEVDEIMDTYLSRCHELICPFGSSPLYGMCEQLVGKTDGLSVQVLFKLSVLWGLENYFNLTEGGKLMQLGSEILREFQRKVLIENLDIECGSCYRELRMVSDIIHSDGTNDTYTNAPYPHFPVNLTELNFILYSNTYTFRDCQLSNVLQNAVKMFGEIVEITMDGTLVMILKADLMKESYQTALLRSTTIIKKGRDKGCYVTYSLKTDKICPRIRIRYSDIEPYLTENSTKVIQTLFTSTQILMDEYKEICVNDYFETLGRVEFKISIGVAFVVDTEISILLFISEMIFFHET